VPKSVSMAGIYTCSISWRGWVTEMNKIQSFSICFIGFIIILVLTACGKYFVIATNSIVSGTRKDLSVWEKYIDCMMNGLSIRKTDKCRDLLNRPEVPLAA